MSTNQQPRIVCAACQKVEVGIFDLLCPDCRPMAVKAGLIPDSNEQRDQRIQIGPTDV